MQSPHAGIALSHRLFWVLHRVQAFLAVNALRLALILVPDSGRIAAAGFCFGLYAEGMRGDRRVLEVLIYFAVRVESAAGAGNVRDFDREGAGFRIFGFAGNLARLPSPLRVISTKKQR